MRLRGSVRRRRRRARGMIVTFLALLEMIRLKLVRVFQQGNFGPIRVYKRERPKARRVEGLARPARPRRPIDAGRRSATETERSMSDLKAIIEALIFASPEPVTLKTLAKLLDTEPKEDIVAAIEALKQDYDRPGGLQMVEVAGGYQIVTRPELHEWVRRLFHERTTQKLSVAVARDAGRHRLQAAGHRARDRRDSRRQHRRRPRHARRAQAHQDRRPQAGRRAVRSSTARRASSSSASA